MQNYPSQFSTQTFLWYVVAVKDCNITVLQLFLYRCSQILNPLMSRMFPACGFFVDQENSGPSWISKMERHCE